MFQRLVTWALPVTLIFYAVSSRAQSSGWRLVWSDEFNYSGAPDPTKWVIDTGGGGFGNGELEYYTDRPDNVRVENGYLVIEARKEVYLSNNYTSARIHTVGAGWKYGHMEIRAKVPGGAGTWPAAWMLASAPIHGHAEWPDNGEVDIMEHVGRDPTVNLGSFYTKNFNWMLGTGKSKAIAMSDMETDFHVFALDWQADQISLSVDGAYYNTFTNPQTNWEDWPFDQNFYLILNLAIGGGYAGPVDDSIFPQQLLIDYVRVYQSQAPADLAQAFVAN